ncbi:phytanoyl-CoA dioxygenase family protein [Hyphobacterium sp.]|uniref:phytanoyl-CoA dioxygenase family protein n=1 Tax=Hyphobacterium sp. TaxID=2004662 RepID=UPI003B52800E
MESETGEKHVAALKGPQGLSGTRSDSTRGDMSVWLGDRSFADCKAAFDMDGYLIIPNVLPPAKLTEIRSVLRPYIDGGHTGRNDFEGMRTNRVYALLAKSPVFAELVEHELALAFAEADLGLSMLLSACLAINLHPDESVQPWHTDDAHIELPFPHLGMGVSTFWAIDETTEENGATEILPGSHLWGPDRIPRQVSEADFINRDIRDPDDDPGFRADAIKAVMPAGSLMIAKGGVWHRGGANRSGKPRLIITPQYCAGWARPLENMMAAVPRETAKALSPRVQSLLGFSIHAPFMGYVDGMHPGRLLAG